MSTINQRLYTDMPPPTCPYALKKDPNDPNKTIEYTPAMYYHDTMAFVCGGQRESAWEDTISQFPESKLAPVVTSDLTDLTNCLMAGEHYHPDHPKSDGMGCMKDSDM
jgi:hypothetical protein